MESLFFDKLIGDSDEPIIDILRARGFFIHQNNNGYYLSDNATNGDSSFLDFILKKYCLGEYIENRQVSSHTENNQLGNIVIFKNTKVEDAKRIFTENGRIGFESTFLSYPWKYFLYRNFGNKCDINILEPYVARYIKSISACGVMTNFSCDGNHKNGGKIIVGCCDKFEIWHNWLYENVVPTEYKSQQYKNGTIIFNSDTQFDEYYKLNMAAKYLYEQRTVLRNLKHIATKRYEELYGKHDSGDIFEFQEILSSLSEGIL